MNLSQEAAAVSAAYDRHYGRIRRWIARKPGTTFWAGVGAVAAAFWLGIKWAGVLAWLARTF